MPENLHKTQEQWLESEEELESIVGLMSPNPPS